MKKYWFKAKRYGWGCLVGLMVISGCGAAASTPPAPAPTTEPVVSAEVTPQPLPMQFDPTKHHTAVLHTSQGDITISLNFGETPNTVKNFVELARKNFYDKTIFHRVLKGFMIQGGDPNGDGSGGPGYKFDDEPFTGEYTRGTVAMANAGHNTNGSQFFIMHADVPLSKDYVIFGHVTAGMDAVDKIAESQVTMSPTGELSKPVVPALINTVEIQEQE